MLIFNILVSDVGLSYQSALNLSLICVAWTKVNFYEKALQDKVVECLLEIQDSLNGENIQEICKILWCFSNSDYANESLVTFIEKFVKQEREALSINNLIDILLSTAIVYRSEIGLISYLFEVINYLIKIS